MRHSLTRTRWRLEKWAGASRPIILMYHRVATLRADPWRLAVSPGNFASQIQTLARTHDVVPLDRIHEPGQGRRRVAITFDDGYHDVLSEAVPVLERHDCPATLFLTMGMVGRGEFWWDRLTRIMLESVAAGPIEIALPGLDRVIVTGARFAPMRRRRAYHAVWGLLRLQHTEYRQETLDLLARLFGVDETGAQANRTATAEEVSALDGSILRLGAHTMNHPSLPTLDRAQQACEIADSRSACAELTGKLPNDFAYPFGDYDAATVECVRDAGFSRAVTVGMGVVRSHTPRFRLPRVTVEDWDGETLLRKLP